jgi:hypothetical protein
VGCGRDHSRLDASGRGRAPSHVSTYSFHRYSALHTIHINYSHCSIETPPVEIPIFAKVTPPVEIPNPPGGNTNPAGGNTGTLYGYCEVNSLLVQSNYGGSKESSSMERTKAAQVSSSWPKEVVYSRG